MSLDYDDDGRCMSSETRAVVENEVRALVQAAYARARHILAKHQGELHALAGELLEKETLSGDQIKLLLPSAGEALTAASVGKSGAGATPLVRMVAAADGGAGGLPGDVHPTGAAAGRAAAAALASSTSTAGT